MKDTLKPLNNLALKFFYLMVFLCAFGCKNAQDKDTLDQIDQVLNASDIRFINKAYIDSLDHMRGAIEDNDIARICKFYKVKYTFYANQGSNAYILYADSALALFKNEDIINENKSTYFDVLLQKGDALYLTSKFTQAVLYYLEARSFREKNLDICKNSALAVRIGNVYFVQQRFTQSASYYKESYQLDKTCSANPNLIKQFYEFQARLNTIGYCYEKAKMLDSAMYFYNEDIKYIDASRKNKRIPTYSLNDAALVAYDNLGSIYLKKGDLVNAEEFLKKCVSITYSAGDDAKIPPTIKLADLYTQKGNYNLAEFYLKNADSLLQSYQNLEYRSRWSKVKFEFYAKQQKYNLAYAFQKQFIKLRDSVNTDIAKLSTINVEKDFANLEQKYNLQDLKKQDSTKNLYLVFASFLIIMIVVIVFLLLRIVNQSRNNLKISKHQNQQLQETLSKLENANQNYARVMKVMAHDLKNPLSGIAGISALLLDEENNDSKNKESIEIIKTSADNALGMINEILNSSLFVTGRTYMKRENINIQLVLQQCVSLLNFKAKEKKQKLVISSNKALIVHANKEKLWQVFNNIIVNAIKFSQEGTEIKMSIKDAARYVIVSVSDHGIGIPPEAAPKIYDIFTEAKRLGTMGEKAYGLGLSISKQIVEAHGGKIWFEDNIEGGTIFYIKLPK